MSAENDNNKDKSFNVVDKRRFDSSGQERATEQQQTPPRPQTDQAQQTTQDATQFTLKDSPQDNEPEPIAFTSFIMSMGTQVMVQLGEMPAPSGMEIPFDLESARQTIDIMTMLQRRTRGNLSAEEARFLEEVLHSLRISYINAKKKAG